MACEALAAWAELADPKFEEIVFGKKFVVLLCRMFSLLHMLGALVLLLAGH